MRKRIVIFLIILGLAACSRFPSGSSTKAVLKTETAVVAETQPVRTQPAIPTPTQHVTRGTVTLWHSWNEEQRPYLEEILKGFSARYPDVLFDVLYVPRENMLARFTQAAQDGAGPDVLIGPAEWGPVLSRSGLLSDLSSLVGDQLIATINRPALASAQDRGVLTGLPYALDGVVLYRNKALIPRSADTLDEMVALAKAATQGEIVGADLDQGFLYSGGHLEGLGGKLMNADGSPAFNSKQGAAWLEMLTALAQAAPAEYNSDEDLARFKEGRVGWIIDGTWNMNALSEAIGPENLSVDPWPAYHDGALSGFVFPSNLYLSRKAQGDGREAAWKFIEYFLSPESQARLVDAGLIPAVSGVKIADPRREILLTQALTALAGGATYPAQPEMKLYLAPLEAAIQASQRGKLPPGDALATSEAAILTALARANATPTTGP
jgi:arabinogalactan oligomer / maltooligosaccharide transport system substrate-binding protein